MPEDEFVEVNLELRFAYSVVGADQPLLEVPDSAIGKWYSRLRAFPERGSQWLSVGAMFEASFRETVKALEAIGVDGRTGRDVLVEEGEDARPEQYPYGRFARLYDPEGDAIELWEPAVRDQW